MSPQRLMMPVVKVCSFTIAVFGLSLMLPLATAWIYSSDNAAAYTLVLLICESLALAGAIATWNYQIHALTPRHMFLITSVSWLLMSLLGALPLLLTDTVFSLSDAVFESTSGLTTTGSTVLTGLDNLPADILLWRSMLQWIGGLGVIAMAVAILPFLRVGGMRLFQTESSDWSDKALPRAKTMISRIIYFYLVLTALCTGAYMLAGMDSFHAINHAMTTLSTGGFSTSDNSFAQFDDLGSHWVAIVFMMIGALPFTLYVQSLSQRRWLLWKDQQLRGFVLIVIAACLVLSLYQILVNHQAPLRALTLSSFNLISVISTTGFASGDYSHWGPFAAALFFFATFMGGCSGSTSGGVKMFRFQLLAISLKESLSRALHPRAVVPRRYNGHKVDDAILLSSVAYLFVMLISLMLITLLLSFSGVDFDTALTGASTALMNVGPGLGELIGPAGNFASLSDASKWILSVGMLLGRLEFITVLVLFTPAFWRS